jgi:hypothetical protein
LKSTKNHKYKDALGYSKRSFNTQTREVTGHSALTGLNPVILAHSVTPAYPRYRGGYDPSPIAGDSVREEFF